MTDIKCASWDDHKRRILLQIIKTQISQGKNGDNGFKKDAWTSIMVKFNRDSSSNYSKIQIQNQYTNLKKRYGIFCMIKDSSGFGWDQFNQTATAPPDVWQDYLLMHPQAKEFQGKGFQLFNELREILDGSIATGLLSSSSTDHESGVCSSEDFNEIIATPSKVRRSLEDSNEVTKTNKSLSSTSSNNTAPAQKKSRATFADDAIGKGLERLADSHLKVQILKGESLKEEIQRTEPSYKIAIKDFLSTFEQEFTSSERLIVAEYFACNDVFAGMYNLLDYDMKRDFVTKILFNQYNIV